MEQPHAAESVLLAGAVGDLDAQHVLNLLWVEVEAALALQFVLQANELLGAFRCRALHAVVQEATAKARVQARGEVEDRASALAVAQDAIALTHAGEDAHASARDAFGGVLGPDQDAGAEQQRDVVDVVDVDGGRVDVVEHLTQRRAAVDQHRHHVRRRDRWGDGAVADPCRRPPRERGHLGELAVLQQPLGRDVEAALGAVADARLGEPPVGREPLQQLGVDRVAHRQLTEAQTQAPQGVRAAAETGILFDRLYGPRVGGAELLKVASDVGGHRLDIRRRSGLGERHQQPLQQLRDGLLQGVDVALSPEDRVEVIRIAGRLDGDVHAVRRLLQRRR